MPIIIGVTARHPGLVSWLRFPGYLVSGYLVSVYFVLFIFIHEIDNMKANRLNLEGVSCCHIINIVNSILFHFRK